MTSDLRVMSYAYPAVASSGRARLARTQPFSDGSFLLSTCLRFEVAAWATSSDFEAGLEACGATEIAGGQLFVGPDAATHLYRVAAGLESPVVGEPEILSQFRAAVADVKNGDSCDGLFVKLLEDAIATGRQIRTTLPYSPHDSLAAIAAQWVGAAPQVAVFGSGTMARAVIEALHHLPAPPRVTVAVRSPDKVNLTGVDVVSFDEAPRLLGEFDGVVSATSAKTRLVDPQQLAAVLARRSAPLTLVDMAMPPDFAPDGHQNLRYIDVDGLAARAAAHLATDRFDEVVAVAATTRYRQIVEHAEIRHAATSLLDHAANAADRAVARYAPQLADHDHRALLERAVQVATRSLVSVPLQTIRHGDARLRRAAHELFRLGGDPS